MSVGVGGCAYLISENENIVQYKYGSFNWNDPKHFNDDKICDGKITIHKNLFSEIPDSSEWIVKKVIEVENCSNCWAKTSDEFMIEIMAFHLIYKILKEYKISNLFPEECILLK